MTHTPPFDLDDYLAGQGQSAILWSVEDVRQLRPDLTSEEAMQVLQVVQESHDAELGVNWDTLRDAALDLYAEASRPPGDE